MESVWSDQAEEPEPAEGCFHELLHCSQGAGSNAECRPMPPSRQTGQNQSR